MLHNDSDCRWCEDDYLPPSDEALARLRTLMASDDVFTPSAVVLTVYTAYGTVTVENINEDSIRLADGRLTCEAQDNSSACPLFTFGSVQGYSTTFA